jgi:hypothetical protein
VITVTEREKRLIDRYVANGLDVLGEIENSDDQTRAKFAKEVLRRTLLHIGEAGKSKAPAGVEHRGFVESEAA